MNATQRKATATRKATAKATPDDQLLMQLEQSIATREHLSGTLGVR